jgi:hypothetical protein
MTPQNHSFPNYVLLILRVDVNMAQIGGYCLLSWEDTVVKNPSEHCCASPRLQRPMAIVPLTWMQQVEVTRVSTVPRVLEILLTC